MPSDNVAPPILVYLVTEDWFFLSHFLARAAAAKRAGWRVVVVARENAQAQHIRAAGMEFHPVDFNRRRLNPVAELALVWQIARLYRRIKPDLVHHVGLKPIILGGLAVKLARIKRVINAPIGMGFIFASQQALARLLRPLARLGLAATLAPRRGVVIFENQDDRRELVQDRLVPPSAAIVIPGAGVDTQVFAPAPEPPGPIKVLLSARMIREKGIVDFATAARILAGKAEFLLAGTPDPGNPNSIPAEKLRKWQEEEGLRWLGFVGDMAALLRDVHIFCLPSTYREGLPKAILEAMAAGRPVVTTDVPGCREAVLDGVTGLIVPAARPDLLAEAIDRLIADENLRARMGAAGRRRAEEQYSDAIICAGTLQIYESQAPARAWPFASVRGTSPSH